MRAFTTVILAGVFTLVLMSSVNAQRVSEIASDSEADREAWYYETETPDQYDPKVIIRQKAMARGAQRAARIAALNWYGMNNSRPTASATPFTGMYSPAWQVPGGRPFGWFPRSRPVYVLLR